MIVIETIIVYLIFINLNTSYAFSAESAVFPRCRSHMRAIREYVEEDVYSGRLKTFYLKSAHHDNQILTGKLNSILINCCKLLQITIYNLCIYSHQMVIFSNLVQCSGAIVARDKDIGCQQGHSIKQLREPKCGNIAFMPCPTTPTNFRVGTRFEICLPGFPQHPHKLIYDNVLR